MVKTPSPKSTSKKSAATKARVDNGLRWSLGVGMTIRTSEHVVTDIEPTKAQRHNRRANFVNTVLPHILKVLRDGGIDVCDDARVENGDLFACRPNGTEQQLVFAYVEPAPRAEKTNGNGAVHADQPGPLAALAPTTSTGKRKRGQTASETVTPPTAPSATSTAVKSGKKKRK